MDVNDIRQREMDTAESSVPESCPSKTEISIETLTRYKSPGNDQIPAEQIQAGSIALYSDIRKLINSTWNVEELLQRWKKFST